MKIRLFSERTKKHYEDMCKNPNATVGFTLAAQAVFASRHDVFTADDSGSDEWRTIARNLKSKYGENLSVDQVRYEMKKIIHLKEV